MLQLDNSQLKAIFAPLGIFFPGNSSDSFVRAQHGEIARLIPVLYAVVAVVTLALSVSYYNSAPLWLTVLIPCAMMIPVTLRLRYWMSVQGKSLVMPIEKVRRDIFQTNYIGPFLVLIFTAVGIGLLSYGTKHHHEIAGIAIWILAMTSAFCLAATPFASITILLCSAAPLTFSLLNDESHVIQTMAGVVVLVSAQVAYMLIQNYKSFREMVNSKAENQTRREEAEIAERAAIVLANTDHLTGLPNRRHFEKILNDYGAAQQSHPGQIAIGILDLDGFKSVNDVFGNNAGDDVLVETAKRLKNELSGSCEIARLGGDEFAFLTTLVTENELLKLAERLQNILGAPYTVQSNRLVSTAVSIGIAVQKTMEISPLRVMVQADIALYNAKANGSSTTSIFTPEMELENQRRARIEQGLRKAIANNALEAHFQPIFEVATQRLIGFESLARWTDDELGIISPSVFIPIAEESGLIAQLTELMLRKAATAATNWPEPLFLSFNVSAEQLVRESSGLRIISLLAECGLSPNRLEIEVTETALMTDLAAAKHTIENLKAAGARISLDDFGTGYSSLSQIRNLPLDKVKIDKSFIDEIVTDSKTRALVETIVTMCKALDIKCTAEGIEQQAQLEALKKTGCHSGQGYLYARPMPLNAAMKLIESAYPKALRKAS